MQRKNINGVIVVSQYLNFTDPAALKRLLEYTNIDLRIDTSNNFHAKCFYFQNGNESTAIIGSSNLTDNALCKNYEFNIQLSSHTDGEIVDQIKKEQQLIYARSVEVTNDFITQYQTYYDALKQSKKEMATLLPMQNGKIVPNKMQTAALQNIQEIRTQKNKNKALLISATGTGKTYLSAFDVAVYKPKKLLFLVHRSTIAAKSMASYRQLLSETPGFDFSKTTFGLLDGKNKNKDCDYIFSTIQTMSQDHHFHDFEPNHFDYIVIDETHRAAG